MTASRASASLRARILVRVLRRLIKPRSLHEPDPLRSRALVERFAMPLPLGLATEQQIVGGVPGEWVRRRRGQGAAPVLVYLHGGAYVVGSPRTHRPLTGAFARRGFSVFAPDYRLAPEHRFPAALEDAVAVYRGLLAAGLAPGRLALAGESAGGGLALAALVRLRELGVPLPAAAALFSPWTDLALTGESLRENEPLDPTLTSRHGVSVARHYLGDTDPRHPLASPLYADLAGLPPLLVHVGASEILLDDSRRLAERATAAGTAVALKIWPVVPHAWQIAAGVLPEARQSIDEAAAFLRAHLEAAAAEGPSP